MTVDLFMAINIKQNMKAFIKDILPYKIVSHYTEKRLNSEIPNSEEPPLYNSYGQRIKTLFLADDRTRDWPYGFVLGRYPRYIFWDRNNYGLINHVYSHEKILKTAGKPARKFALFIEGEAIDPSTYAIFDKYPGLDKDYTCIFTHSARLLDKYSNALFIPGGVFIMPPRHTAVNLIRINIDISQKIYR
jgi:hypothetical protein